MYRLLQRRSISAPTATSNTSSVKQKFSQHSIPTRLMSQAKRPSPTTPNRRNRDMKKVLNFHQTAQHSNDFSDRAQNQVNYTGGSVQQGQFNQVINQQQKAPVKTEQQYSKKTRVYNYDTDLAHREYLINHRMAYPSLQQIIPNIDDSLIDLNTLDKLSRSRYYQLADYLTKLNATRKSNPRLQDDNVFREFEKTLITVNSQKNVLFSIDIEAYERKPSLITEIGISIYDPLKDATSLFPNLLNIHILVKEFLHLRNGSFVNDNKDNFLCGSSIILTLDESRKLVQTLIDHYFVTRQRIGMNGVVVGHALQGDVSWLKSIGVNFPLNVQVADSQRLYILADNINRSSLGAILQRLNLPHSHLHNGGNDAYFTLVLLMKLSDPNFRKFHNLDSFQSNEAYRDLFLQRKNMIQPVNREKKAKKQLKSEFVPSSQFDSIVDALHTIYEK